MAERVSLELSPIPGKSASSLNDGPERKVGGTAEGGGADSSVADSSMKLCRKEVTDRPPRRAVGHLLPA